MNITRRSAIRTLSLGAGSSLLAPVFSQLMAQAAGAPVRKRFVFVVQSNGINPNHIMQSVRNRQKRIDQSQDGVYLPKNRRDAMEAGRFALGD